MAGYVFRTFDERKQIENLWEAGTPAKEIADKLNISIPASYTELRRGTMPNFPTNAAVTTLSPT